MKLHLGIMKNKELAQWFGIALKSYTNNRVKKLEVLKKYADFDIVRGGVNIKEIYEEEYNGKSFEQIKGIVDEVWSEDGLDSCARVGLEIGERLPLTVKDSTIYKYTRLSRNELYGVPFREGGSLGSCVYTWCKKHGDGVESRYELLTAEEEEIKQQLIKKYFGDASEKQIIVKGMVATGEIKKEEAWDVLEELTNMRDGNFMMFLRELQEKVGCQIIRGTLVTRNERIEF